MFSPSLETLLITFYVASQQQVHVTIYIYEGRKKRKIQKKTKQNCMKKDVLKRINKMAIFVGL